MIERLEQIEQRYRELSEQMAAPEIALDVKRLQELARERATHEEAVAKYGEYKSNLDSLEKTKAMLDDELDGEMIGLDNQFYKIKTDGVAYPVDDSEKTPFAVVTFFEQDQVMLFVGDLDYEKLETELDKRLPTLNIFYAFKIQGTF